MKLPAPRVIAIDDEQDDLNALTDALNANGTACLPIHFSGDDAVVPPCPAVRVIFFDLNLLPGHTEDPTQQFSLIASLIEEKIQPSGPYLVILWTRYPKEACKCRQFLQERLEGVSKPFAVKSLDKSDHLRDKSDHSDVGQPNPVKSLPEAIEGVVSGLPHVAALLNWEERVLDASAVTVGSIQSLAVTSAGARNPDKELGSLLVSLATAAVGEHVEADPFQAVNGALLPILADGLATTPSNDDPLWQAVIQDRGSQQKPDLETAARLNRILHFAKPLEHSRGNERGAVIALPEQYRGDAFKAAFGLSASDAAIKQFACRKFEDAENSDDWVLVQCQAACDYAQKRPGPIPFHLGLLVSSERITTGSVPMAVWRSPCFEIEGKPCYFHVNARFSLSLPRAHAEAEKPLFRLRDQLLNQLIYELHGYGARPGIVSFRK